MAESLKVLRRRVRSVKNIKQITRAMEMVSASKLRRAQSTLMAGRPYAAKLQELLAHLAGGPALAEHPLFQPREGHRKILVLFTADRGLCGSFNSNIVKMAEELMKSEPRTQWQLVCVGRRGRDYFQRRNATILESVLDLKGHPSIEEARRISHMLVARYLAGECDSVWLLYSAFVSSVVYDPTLERYLAMSPESLGLDADADGLPHPPRRGVDYLFDPNAKEVFESLLPRFLAAKIYITMAEVMTSEHSARMVAMNNATKNCDEMGDSLTLRLNNARQAQITKDLLDIVGGAEALR
jgi:F-type H+-transporting ATPase subunit gamma